MSEQTGGFDVQIGGSSEKGERKLVVEWPSREDLMGRMEKYIDENKLKMAEELKVEYQLADELEVAQISKIILGAKFMFLEMNKISPIPLDKHFSISDNYEYQERGTLMGVSKGGADACQIYVDSFWQLMADGVKNLEVVAMGAAVHEFAHMLYKQEAVGYGTSKKSQGWEEKEERRMSTESKTDAYLAVDPEIRARIWQLKFLKKYFPESEHTESVRSQLERGRAVKEIRRKTFAKV